jgi:hypothetical protein
MPPAKGYSYNNNKKYDMPTRKSWITKFQASSLPLWTFREGLVKGPSFSSLTRWCAEFGADCKTVKSKPTPFKNKKLIINDFLSFCSNVIGADSTLLAYSILTHVNYSNLKRWYLEYLEDCVDGLPVPIFAHHSKNATQLLLMIQASQIRWTLS